MGTTMSSFAKADVLAACTKYGPLLHLSSALDGPSVMEAIAMNESSMGVNCGPRHEPAYDTGGRYCVGRQAQLVTAFGSAAAASYGPWQMMFQNFMNSRTPAQLLIDLDACAQDFVTFFNDYVVGVRHAVTISDIGQVWNSGHIARPPAVPSPNVMTYVDHLQSNYATALGSR